MAGTHGYLSVLDVPRRSEEYLDVGGAWSGRCVLDLALWVLARREDTRVRGAHEADGFGDLQEFHMSVILVHVREVYTYVRCEHPVALEVVGPQCLHQLQLIGKRLGLESGDSRPRLVEEVQVEHDVVHEVRTDPGKVRYDRYTVRCEVIRRAHSREHEDLQAVSQSQCDRLCMRYLW